jgi:hypothetical protein
LCNFCRPPKIHPRAIRRTRRAALANALLAGAATGIGAGAWIVIAAGALGYATMAGLDRPVPHAHPEPRSPQVPAQVTDAATTLAVATAARAMGFVVGHQMLAAIRRGLSFRPARPGLAGSFATMLTAGMLL